MGLVYSRLCVQCLALKIIKWCLKSACATERCKREIERWRETKTDREKRSRQLWKIVCQVPKILNIESPYMPSLSAPSICSKELKQRPRQVPVAQFTGALLTAGRTWKCLSISKWMSTNTAFSDTQLNIGHNKSKILVHAIRWMNVRIIMLSEVHQTQKGKELSLLLYGISRVGTSGAESAGEGFRAYERTRRVIMW